MAKKPQTTPPEVLAAQEALQRAEHARLAAQRELERATQARFEAVRALRDARVRADLGLPRAWVVMDVWYEYNPVRTEVVIERRTAATIFTRPPGGDDERQWRKNARGVWAPYPDSGPLCRLEIKGEAE